jgi:hypothetical protein
MQTRFTARGVNNEEQDVLLAFELLEEAFKVNLFIVPLPLLNAEQREFLDTKWTKGEAFEFPETVQVINPELSEDSMLPGNIRSEETGKIRAKQNEWGYLLLTNKLWEAYLAELADLKQKAAGLTAYSRTIFDEAKSFWERVLEHKKDRDISQEKLDNIKEEVNKIFEVLKGLRKNESAEFEQLSTKVKDEVVAAIEVVKAKVAEGGNFKDMSESLKKIQADLKGKRISRADETSIRKAFDGAFQFISEQRNNWFSSKNNSRVEGLQKVINTIENSLNRDKKDLEYYTRKINNPSIKSLELQLLKLKLNMLAEAVSSKEVKLADIRKTLEKLLKPKVKQATVGEKRPGKKEDAAENDTEAAALPVEEDVAAGTVETVEEEEINKEVENLIAENNEGQQSSTEETEEQA